MGHVDHGKTSLLDYIRRTKVAAGEAGGITQHIGAYHVETAKGVITFLDTPGHAAFTAMRARGARATDVVVLVVAADDGVMPQTIEAIQHARAANVPIVVAVNKIDKSDADPERVRTELAKHEVIAEEWGGQNIFVPVSARTGQGIDQLLDAILLQAEVLELRAPRSGLAAGIVIESSIEKGRGAVATVLVKRGTLHMGDPIIAGSEFGRVRAMFDENGKPVQEAPPSMPVVVLGLSAAPNAGDEILVVESERKAREVALYRQGKFRDVKLARSSTRAEDVFSQMGEAKAGVVSVLIKADVQGSAEALREALGKLSTEEVQVKVIASGLGGITESDVQLAAASRALIIGFNVRADAGARDAVKETGVEVRYYSIIYEAIDDVKQMMSGMLQPEIKETIVGVAQVREVFRSSKFGVVAGCLVTEGCRQAQQPDPRAARQRGDLRGCARVAAPLQGRRRRSARRHRVRHRREELPGRARRRSDRMLLARRGGENLAVMAQPRTQRIESQIQRVLAQLIARELKDPRVGNVTITAVSCAADMGSARVFFTPFASTHSAADGRQRARARGRLPARGARPAAWAAACAAAGVRVRRERGGSRAPHQPHRSRGGCRCRGRRPHERYGRRAGA